MHTQSANLFPVLLDHLEKRFLAIYRRIDHSVCPPVFPAESLPWFVMFPEGFCAMIRGSLAMLREEIEFLIKGWYGLGPPVKGHL